MFTAEVYPTRRRAATFGPGKLRSLTCQALAKCLARPTPLFQTPGSGGWYGGRLPASSTYGAA